MDTTPGVGHVDTVRRYTDCIGYKSSRNIHLGVKLARCLGLELNRFVSFNLTQTSCSPARADLALANMRSAFRRWARRPGKSRWMTAFPPTFVWVIENPNGVLNAHWLVHVPADRQAEFAEMVPRWFEAAVGEVYDEKAIKIKPVTNAEGLKDYFLKGEDPRLAMIHGIEPINQGRVIGRRSGHSKNIGPVQVKKWRELRVFPPAKRWVIQ